MKLVRLLKRLEMIDRDIAELRQIENDLMENRTYSDALKISLELQVNNLLNKRIKLMELNVDVPQDMAGKEEDIEPTTYEKKSFQLDELEKSYLPRLLNRQNTFTTNTKVSPEIKKPTSMLSPISLKSESTQRRIMSINSKRNLKGRQPLQKKSFSKLPSLSSTNQKEAISSENKKNDPENDILEDLPTLGY